MSIRSSFVSTIKRDYFFGRHERVTKTYIHQLIVRDKQRMFTGNGDNRCNLIISVKAYTNKAASTTD